MGNSGERWARTMSEVIIFRQMNHAYDPLTNVATRHSWPAAVTIADSITTFTSSHGDGP